MCTFNELVYTCDTVKLTILKKGVGKHVENVKWCGDCGTQ